MQSKANGCCPRSNQTYYSLWAELYICVSSFFNGLCLEQIFLCNNSYIMNITLKYYIWCNPGNLYQNISDHISFWFRYMGKFLLLLRLFIVFPRCCFQNWGSVFSAIIIPNVNTLLNRGQATLKVSFEFIASWNHQW